MALLVTSQNPAVLKNKIHQGIKEERLRTWIFHPDGIHFTHKAEQWKEKAWFKMTAEKETLTFNIVRNQSSAITVDIYAEYNGLLLRMLLADFSTDFSVVRATATATTGDVV